MVCFNVIFYGAAHPFLSTHFALMSSLLSIGVIVLAFLHQRLHPLFKLIQVPREVSWQSNCVVCFGLISRLPAFKGFGTTACGLFNYRFGKIEILPFLQPFPSSLSTEALQQSPGKSRDFLGRHLLLRGKESQQW